MRGGDHPSLPRRRSRRRGSASVRAGQLTTKAPVVAEVVRSGFVEAVHCGTVLALNASGVALSIGDVEAPIFPRSCNKPLQAVGMLRAGLDVDDRQLALVAASHSGTPMHVEIAQSILLGAGLAEADLGNAKALPLDESATAELLASGGHADRIHQNCSGKHAGMLATCVAHGWPTAGYLDPSHPVQVAIRDAVEDLAGEQVASTGVDGCGAPLFALSLHGLVRAFSALTTAGDGTAEHRVATAMRNHPDVVGGPARVVTRLMLGVPGLVAKDGAEGAFAAALPDGRAAAVKIADGASRAAGPVLVAALGAIGCHNDALDELATTPVLGGGRSVGQVRAVPDLCERRHTDAR